MKRFATITAAAAAALLVASEASAVTFSLNEYDATGSTDNALRMHADGYGVADHEYETTLITASVEALGEYTAGATVKDAIEASNAKHGKASIVFGEQGFGVNSGRNKSEAHRIASGEALFFSVNSQMQIDRLESITVYEDDFGKEDFSIYNSKGELLFSDTAKYAEDGVQDGYVTFDFTKGGASEGLVGNEFIFVVTAKSSTTKRGLQLAQFTGRAAEKSDVSSVPLPASAFLLMGALGGLAGMRRKRG